MRAGDNRLTIRRLLPEPPGGLVRALGGVLSRRSRNFCAPCGILGSRRGR